MGTPVASIWGTAPELGITEPPALVTDAEDLWLAYFRAAGDLIAVVRFSGVIDHRLSPINDEGLGKHPYARAGLRFYSFNELKDSDETLRWSGLKARHWVVTFKDNTLDVIATSGEVVAAEVAASSPLEALLSVIPRGAAVHAHPSSVASASGASRRLEAPVAGDRVWFGYASFDIRAPQGSRTLQLPYASEPPFGDSQHRILFEDWTVPGFAWGAGLAWSPESRYVLLDWAERANIPQRVTVAIDLERRATFMFTSCLPFKKFQYPKILGQDGTEIFQFTGSERWVGHAA
jgi:hypothetical protein